MTTTRLPPFQRLVDDHWRDVDRLARALAGPAGEDVAQQAWVQALAAYPRLTSARNLRSWLLTITHRCAMDHHRRRSGGPVPTDEPAALEAAPLAPPADAGLLDEELWQRVGALPPRQREAIVLRYVGDLDHASVGRALGTTPAASRRLVSDALATLRKDLA